MKTDLYHTFRRTAGTSKAPKAPLPPEAARAADMPAPPKSPGSGAYCRIPPRRWFFTFMCMNIPIAGWVYLLHLAFGKKRHQLQDFARAYLLYKLVFLIVALVILGILVYIGLDLADQLLAYMEML